MGEQPKTLDRGDDSVDQSSEAEDRAAILGRRARFIATALSALAIGTASVQGGCDSEVNRETSSSGGEGGAGGAPQPCLDVAAPDAASSGGDGGMPQPCLGMPADGGGGMGGRDGDGGAGAADGSGGSGGDDGLGGGSGGGGGALPCLAPKIRR